MGTTVGARPMVLRPRYAVPVTDRGYVLPDVLVAAYNADPGGPISYAHATPSPSRVLQAYGLAMRFLVLRSGMLLPGSVRDAGQVYVIFGSGTALC
eukprot:3940321-Rhodomonas_salina.4